MKNPNHAYPSIAKFQQFVELKDYRPPTKKEYVRYVRKLAEHFGCDPLALSEDQLRAYFLFLPREKHYTRSPMKPSTDNSAKCKKERHTMKDCAGRRPHLRRPNRTVPWAKAVSLLVSNRPLRRTPRQPLKKQAITAKAKLQQIRLTSGGNATQPPFPGG